MTFIMVVHQVLVTCAARQALAARDIAGIYRLLNDAGMQ